MRQRTQWALGGVLAGTALLGMGGTLAAFSDTEQVRAEVGAGSLSLTVTPQPELRRGVVGQEVDTPLVAAMSGHGPARLTVSVVTGLPMAVCAEHPQATVVVRGPMESAGVPLSLCQPRATPVPLSVLSDAQPDAAVSATPGGDPGAWSSSTAVTLRFTLTQLEGGFSDQVDVPVELAILAGVDTGTGEDAIEQPVPGQPEGSTAEQVVPDGQVVPTEQVASAE